MLEEHQRWPLWQKTQRELGCHRHVWVRQALVETQDHLSRGCWTERDRGGQVILTGQTEGSGVGFEVLAGREADLLSSCLCRHPRRAGRLSSRRFAAPWRSILKLKRVKLWYGSHYQLKLKPVNWNWKGHLCFVDERIDWKAKKKKERCGDWTFTSKQKVSFLLQYAQNKHGNVRVCDLELSWETKNRMRHIHHKDNPPH